MLRVLLFFIPLFISYPAFPQANTLTENETILKELFEQLYLTGSDGEKNQLNDSILKVMPRMIQFPASFNYPFDSLKRIGNVRSPDNTFRIFTWNVPLSNFVNEYHGIIQLVAGNNTSSQVFVLKDQTRRLEELLHEETTVEKWPGMIRRLSMYYILMKTGNRFSGSRFSIRKTGSNTGSYLNILEKS
jgi:hypothetical protein